MTSPISSSSAMASIHARVDTLASKLEEMIVKINRIQDKTVRSVYLQEVVEKFASIGKIKPEFFDRAIEIIHTIPNDAGRAFSIASVQYGLLLLGEVTKADRITKTFFKQNDPMYALIAQCTGESLVKQSQVAEQNGDLDGARDLTATARKLVDSIENEDSRQFVSNKVFPNG